jgi:hypothetical protein
LPLAILNQLNALFTGVQAGIKVTQGNTGSANFVIQTDNISIDINSNNQLEVKPSYTADFVTQAELTEALDTITGGTASTVDTTANIIVAGVTVGGYTTGDTITSGTSLETILNTMLIKEIPPTYVNPTLTLSGGGNYEAGTNVADTFTPSWAQNNAGSQTGYTLKENGSTIYTASSAGAYTQSSFQIGDTTDTYIANVAYSEGAILNDNLGNPYPTGHIPAGNINSNNVYINGYRNLFYGCSGDSTTSAGIRALSNSVLNPSNGTSFTITIPEGATNVIFAYPATLEDVSSVEYVEGLYAQVKSIFTETTLNVLGANSYSGINYKVYTYTPAEAFSSVAHYNVVI